MAPSGGSLSPMALSAEDDSHPLCATAGAPVDPRIARPRFCILSGGFALYSLKLPSGSMSCFSRDPDWLTVVLFLVSPGPHQTTLCSVEDTAPGPQLWPLSPLPSQLLDSSRPLQICQTPSPEKGPAEERQVTIRI